MYGFLKKTSHKASADMEDAKEKIKELVERFYLNLDAYKKGSYNETQLRREFIDPFFEALGWDVQNKQGFAEQYKEVVHEDSIKVGISLKAPDYSFRIGGQRKFFLETKKPAINIKEDTSPAYQLRRYAWSAKLPLSILTDFEEFAVYDCRIKPMPSDKVSTGRIAYYTYEQYIGKFDEIYDRFSKEAVLKGSFDRYIETTKGMRGTAEVDKEFLREIESWRESLAKNLALRNPRLTVDELNFAVQQTIDRIIFLRICEDRGIESYGRLQALLNGTNTYRRLFEQFYQADAKYNSGLFDFTLDKLTPVLSTDDKILKDIIESLYYPNSPYEFSVLGAEILGNVYEQFLGKVIRLTAGHAAKVEEKPEVKKAGGVYYTPSYIVRYIVENTVGKLLECKTPKQAEKLRILDPACGSGSFLIGAYQYLLDWHTRWYNENNPEKHATGKKPAVYRSRAGWQLTTTEKKRILLNNIYGVDIDRQAVEVTKLSLLLKVLEGENEETIGKTLALFRERALPDLKDNIKCGNSLIGPDFYDSISPTLPFSPSLDGRGKTTSPLAPDRFNRGLAGKGTIISSPSPSTGEGWGGGEMDMDRRINVFDWNDDEKGFGRIMKEGGFDCVIGNPPYVKIQVMQESQPVAVEELRRKYKSAQSGNYDIYIVFIEKGLNLLRKEGLLGFICPHKFFNQKYGQNLRNIISEGKNIFRIVHFSDIQIFNNATTYTCLLFLRKSKSEYFEAIKLSSIDYKPEYLGSVHFEKFPISAWHQKEWNIQSQSHSAILDKLLKFPSLESITTNIFQGPKAGADNVFILTLKNYKKKTSVLYSASLGEEVELENSILAKYIKGKFIKKYYLDYSAQEYAIFPYDKIGQLYSEDQLQKQFPLTYEYLSDPCNKKILLSREEGRFKNSFWQYSRPQNMKILFNEKILTPFNAFKNSFAYDNNRDFLFSAGVSGAYGVLLKPDINITYKFLLCILNSNVVKFFIQNTSTCLRGGFYSYENKYIKNIPIPFIDLNKSSKKALHDKTVSLVDNMLELNKKLPNAKTPHEKELIERQIKITDNQIDRLVYELYGLTEEEIGIVEYGNK